MLYLRYSCVFNAGKARLPEKDSPELKQIEELDLVMNVYKDGEWGSYRHLPYLSANANTTATRHAYVNVHPEGSGLSNLRWIESPMKFSRAGVCPQSVVCDVQYSAVNFRDVMLATGKLPPDAIPGE